MSEAIHILLVEDNEGDIFLTKEAFQEKGIYNDISVVRDGKEAIDFLSKTENYVNAPSADLVLMDINLPKKNGIEVLKYIRDNEQLKELPVIMVTTSSSEIDKRESFKNGVNFFMTKPLEVNDFLNAIINLKRFNITIKK